MKFQFFEGLFEVQPSFIWVHSSLLLVMFIPFIVHNNGSPWLFVFSMKYTSYIGYSRFCQLELLSGEYLYYLIRSWKDWDDGFKKLIKFLIVSCFQFFLILLSICHIVTGLTGIHCVWWESANQCQCWLSQSWGPDYISFHWSINSKGVIRDSSDHIDL